MESRKSYGQFCALARALDHVGDRWTLLIVRELLLGPKSYRDLHRALPGIGPNLLVDRLRRLEGDGLVGRNDQPARSKAVSYALTPAGAELRPAVYEMIRWGARWMTSGVGADRTDSRWASLALSALIEGPTAGQRQATVHLELDGEHLTVRWANGRRSVGVGRPQRADARVVASLPDMLAFTCGLRDERAVAIHGDVELARATLSL